MVAPAKGGIAGGKTAPDMSSLMMRKGKAMIELISANINERRMGLARGLGVLLLCASVALAQHVVGARAGTIQFTIGDVLVDGEPVTATQSSFSILKEGQSVRTDIGLVEILLAPSVFLRLGEQSAVRMVSTQLEDTQVELLNGTALVEVIDSTKEDRVQMRFGETLTEFKRVGLYRFDLDTGTLRIFGGTADVRAGSRRVRIGRGKAVHLESSLSDSNFNRKQTDELHQWAARRSFDLFASSPEARRHLTNWETTPSGWSWNRDFEVRLFSPIVAYEYRVKQAEMAERADASVRALEQGRVSAEQAWRRLCRKPAAVIWYG
jgi:hypothetical protein